MIGISYSPSLLGLMLGMDNDGREPPRALIRLEDIHVGMDAVALRTALDVLEEDSIPFLLTVIPHFLNGQRGRSLTSAPELLAQLHRAERMGGRIFQHGYTHHRGLIDDPGEDIDPRGEFFNPGSSEPARAQVLQSVRKGRMALRRMGLHPVGWTTPHYDAHPSLYSVFNQVYPLAMETHRYLAGRHTITIPMPYPVVDAYGTYLLPDTLGYVQSGGNSLKNMLDRSSKRLALRRAWAGLVVHPYLLGPGSPGSVLTKDEFRQLVRVVQQQATRLLIH